MTQDATTATHTAPETAEQPSAFVALPRLAAETASRERFLRVAVHVISEHFGGYFAAGSFTVGAFTVSEATIPGDASTWTRVARDALLEAQTNGKSLARAFATSDPDRFVGVLAAALPAMGETEGAIVAYCTCESQFDLTTRLNELRSLTGLLAGLLEGLGSGARTASSPGADVAAHLNRARDYTSPYQLGFALVNAMASKLACDQVAMGRPRGGRVRFLAISGLDDVKARPPGAARMREAMEECADLARPICVQAEDPWRDDTVTKPFRLHQRWHENAGRAAVASVPLMVGDEVIAILSLRRRADQAFTFDELTRVRDLAAPFAPALLLVERSARSVPRHAFDTLRDAAVAFTQRKAWARRVIALAVTVFIAWFCLGTLPFSLTAPATIAPPSVTHLAAPFAAKIAVVHAEPGDELRAGDPVYRLDTREMELRLSEINAQAAAERVAMDLALAEGKTGEAEMARARLGVLLTEAEATSHRIEAATVRAPTDGIVLAGDLSKLVGQAVRQGEALVKFAPTDGWLTEIALPEHSIDHLRVAQAGSFAPIAAPGDKLAFEIESIAPAAEIRDGRNVFVAKARVTNAPIPVRAGMEGTARIQIDDRPVWWLATRRLADFIRLRFWL